MSRPVSLAAVQMPVGAGTARPCRSSPARVCASAGAVRPGERGEARASGSPAVVRGPGLDQDGNVDSGALALGDPVVMSGARLVLSLQERTRGGGYSVVMLGVGQGRAGRCER